MNGSDSERFEALYRRIWHSLHRGDDPDLSEHERQLLHHVPRLGGVPLTWLAHHLGFPKSTTSVLVKDLERRGFVTRGRNPDDERLLAVALTPKGRRRVDRDTVLEPRGLERALSALPETERRRLLRSLERLADEAERSAGRAGAPRDKHSYVAQ